MFYKDIFSGVKHDWSLNNQTHIQQSLQDDGLIILENITSKEDFLAQISHLGEIVYHFDSTEDGLTHIVNYAETHNRADAALSNRLGLTQGALTPHTDRSGLETPPSLLAFWIESQSHNGGSSLFVDSHLVFEELSVINPEATQILTRPNSVIFKSEKGLLESSIFEIDQQNLYVRFRFDKMVYFSTEVSQVMPDLLKMIEKCTIRRKLGAGNGYILNNRRWLHGRTHFFGDRSAYRLLMK
ncbi:TauD/TfdA family dioxygenase [Acinetobacter sp.]|jgi:alpha-ketoglutarate-dependent taurine dioxygenase|uniref:TauD/TfdA family dioxygenase n=1 Tax=Acinetobacter sp. TaxID=472 RepID=UPI002825A982|nr:TauD/TfdA family dioxygenase [Acinetobacter sp.]MDR2248961.1 TauD/TfdA family dioxygenase [Acinetobacter sp.]